MASTSQYRELTQEQVEIVSQPAFPTTEDQTKSGITKLEFLASQIISGTQTIPFIKITDNTANEAIDMAASILIQAHKRINNIKP